MQKSGILHLTLQRQWFDMIEQGIKLEEYREIKPYWNKRLLTREYDAILFVNGYGAHRPRMIVKLNSILQGFGLTKWGAPPDKHVHILRLGPVLHRENL